MSKNPIELKKYGHSLANQIGYWQKMASILQRNTAGGEATYAARLLAHLAKERLKDLAVAAFVSDHAPQQRGTGQQTEVQPIMDDLLYFLFSMDMAIRALLPHVSKENTSLADKLRKTVKELGFTSILFPNN